MKTFPHWRAVGRAMLDARRRGFTPERVKAGHWTRFTWDQDGTGVTIYVRPDRPVCQFVADFGKGWINRSTFDDAATVLRVLAALELIPADIAYAADERYGRCVKCGLLAQWWPAEAESGERWVHVSPWPADGHTYHRPEVAS